MSDSDRANEVRHVQVGEVTLGNDRPLTLIAGPCALESRDHALEMSHALVEMAERLKIGFIYKTSFDKANRTSVDSPRGVGLSQGLTILAEVDALLVPLQDAWLAIGQAGQPAAAAANSHLSVVS